ncbi:hypothetical protein, partial [Treponema sp. R6D11]
LWEKDYLYEGHYILPYCPRCATVLSNHELNLGGYKDVHDPAITIKFKLRGEVSPRASAASQPTLPPSAGDTPATPPNTYLLAWTTTPWTLPSNLALTLG